MKVFQASFSTALEPADPYQRAIRAGLDPETASRVDQVSPVRWPSQDRESATMTRLEEEPPMVEDPPFAEDAGTAEDPPFEQDAPTTEESTDDASVATATPTAGEEAEEVE